MNPDFLMTNLLLQIQFCNVNPVVAVKFQACIGVSCVTELYNVLPSRFFCISTSGARHLV
jgi:hypothetical protein